MKKRNNLLKLPTQKPLKSKFDFKGFVLGVNKIYQIIF